MDALVWAGGDYLGPLPIPAQFWCDAEAHDWGFVVAADSGARHAIRLKSRIDLILGDFDSLAPALRERLENIPSQAFPVDKNYTDGELAVMRCQERGARRILIAGGLGDRFDQSLSAAQLLFPLAKDGICGCVTDGRQRLYALLDGELALPARPGDIFSLIPFAPQVPRVHTEGLRWSLNDDTLRLGESRSVSNEATAERVRVRAAGPLLITVFAMAQRLKQEIAGEA